jgi:hypothetical protein
VDLSDQRGERAHDDLVHVHVVRLLDCVLDGAADGVRLDRHLAVGFHPFARGLVANGVDKFRLDHAWVDAGTANFVALLSQAFRDRSHRELGGRVDGGGRLNDEPAD